MNWITDRQAEKKRLSGQEEIEAESLRVKTPAAAAPAARALRAERHRSKGSSHLQCTPAINTLTNLSHRRACSSVTLLQVSVKTVRWPRGEPPVPQRSRGKLRTRGRLRLMECSVSIGVGVRVTLQHQAHFHLVINAPPYLWAAADRRRGKKNKKNALQTTTGCKVLSMCFSEVSVCSLLAVVVC